jgi:hypothetical protein
MKIVIKVYSDELGDITASSPDIDENDDYDAALRQFTKLWKESVDQVSRAYDIKAPF